MQAQTEFLLFSVKLIEYIFSADSVYSNPEWTFAKNEDIFIYYQSL